MDFLILVGSTKKASVNAALALELKGIVRPWGGVSIASLAEVDLPVFSEDIEEVGIPSGVTRLGSLLAQAGALVIVTPEYNGSIPGPLKNALDWLSRLDPVPLRRKPVLLISASPGAMGGIRGLWHTRVPLEALGAHVFPDMMAFGKAPERLPLSERDQKQFADLLGQFQSFSLSLSKGG